MKGESNLEYPIIINNGSSCETCGLYNGCTYKDQFTTHPRWCTQWVKIYEGNYVKTDGAQIHSCPCCGHKWWE